MHYYNTQSDLATVSENDLLDSLQIQGGIVCLVGAGGKKTTLYALAQRFSGRIGITTTVHLPPFPRSLPGTRVIAPPEQLIEQVVSAAQHHRLVAFAHPSQTDYRVTGVSLDALDSIQQRARFELLLVKADGARQRLLKAPAAYEPVIPPSVSTVLALVSAQTIGRRLDEHIAHRVERIEAITGARRGELIQPLHIARLLADEQGLLQGAGSAQVVPIINQVDTAELHAQAADAARQALALTDRFDRVVLASMYRPQPIIEVIRR
ncbi:MAG: putative selenium-dependent hydroxylase accessory protein YqeC [Candidatus Competibacteraceae bacterium]|nr:putative selenium-dependent hydroxylase accessory protein YqeC [Candidatus Competibacteraceae bacterium]MCB1811307.1 putative selenium-dependent hydroxylase accessory protein YqeC [Candidatus Competibacteraceae bacterium]